MLDLLVHVANYSAPGAGLRYAAQLNTALGGTLTGVFVAEPIVPLGPAGLTPVAPQMYAAVAKTVEEARQAEPVFRRWAGEQGVKRFGWQIAHGWFASALASAANWHDALVLESGVNAVWGSPGLLGQALVGCGVPCFVLPDDYNGTARLDTIVLASHGSAEAVRAAHAALPLLARARRVVLAKGQPRETFSPVAFQPGFTLEEHLSRHGIAFETRVLEGTDAGMGAEILAAATDVAADLLVLGAFGRTRFSEWVLGGVTRHMLEHARLPLFFRH